MTAYFEIADTAREDLLQIAAYIAADSTNRADAQLDRIYRECELLGGRTRIGRARPDLSPSIRSFPVDSFVIFYRELPVGVQILRVLHGARDVGRILADEG
ncbi:MAG: type II toxin-antitoxin system RelE/ParE family toxin [Planctomycetota bacterium]